MKNFEEMRDRISRLSADLETGTINVKESEAQANLAGKMINNNKTKLEYDLAKKKHPDICNPYFEESKIRPIEDQASKPRKLSQRK